MVESTRKRMPLCSTSYYMVSNLIAPCQYNLAGMAYIDTDIDDDNFPAPCFIMLPLELGKQVIAPPQVIKSGDCFPDYSERFSQSAKFNTHEYLHIRSILWLTYTRYEPCSLRDSPLSQRS